MSRTSVALRRERRMNDIGKKQKADTSAIRTLAHGMITPHRVSYL